MDFRLKTHHSEHYDRYKMLYCRGSNVSKIKIGTGKIKKDY